MKVCYVTHKPNLTGANRSLRFTGRPDRIGMSRSCSEPPRAAAGRTQETDILINTRSSCRPYLDNKVPTFETVLNSVPVNRLCVETVKGDFGRSARPRPQTFASAASACRRRELKLPYLCHFRTSGRPPLQTPAAETRPQTHGRRRRLHQHQRDGQRVVPTLRHKTVVIQTASTRNLRPAGPRSWGP